MTDWPPAELRTRLLRVCNPRTATAAASLWAHLRRAPVWRGRRQLARLHDSALALFDLLAERRQG
jgi:hypothetical protein